ncbi:MAG: carboxyl transferase domain-containing protein [Pseudomonadota bacterium]
MSRTFHIRSPLQGQLVNVTCAVGDSVAPGTTIATLELMKMQHVVQSPVAGFVTDIAYAVGDLIEEASVLVSVRLDDTATANTTADDEASTTSAAADELQEARALTLDAARPDVFKAREAAGRRSARENIDDLIDAGSFREIGQLVFAAQRARRSIDDLKQRTPADGLVAGLATINAERATHNAHCAVLHYDYTVLAGTQGAMNHAKTDRLLAIANEGQRPVIFFTEGGGGRPGDVDVATLAGLHVPSFAALARLSGQVPLVGVASGYCFAGNAAFLGCCDVVIATRDTSIGMGGPAMIEGGGLGRVAAADVGPADRQFDNGVIDILVEDDVAAVDAARRYLAFFQGDRNEWQPSDVDLDQSIPANRLQVYDMRSVIAGIADADSVLELRAGFAPGMVTAFATLAGRNIGIIANNPTHLAGAIEHDGADKAARFMQLCDAHGIPIVSLCDTPGIMVGTESEQQAQVRHASRLFVTGTNLTVPLVAVIIRKAYGLGAMAMAGGGFHETQATVAWPSGEFGAMGIEGAVRLGYRKELEAIADPEAREAEFRRRVDDAYERGKALNAAPYFEFDAVIQPSETRQWLIAALATHTTDVRGQRPNVDTW